MKLSNCDGSLENIAFTVAMVMFLVALVSAFQLFRNEKKLEGKKAIVPDVLGGFHPLFTSKYLNDVGKKWRPFFLSSVLYLIIFFILSAKYEICI